MQCKSLFIFISLLTLTYGTYNPISTGCVVISTISKIFILQPIEYGGTDNLNTIYTAPIGTTIVSTIFDPTARNLYILFTNTTNGTIYLSQLASLEQLSSTIYRLPMTFNIANLNQLNSFTSDVSNSRGFHTDQTGNVTLFSMAGLLEMLISMPATITAPVRSVGYANSLNLLYVITDATVSSCSNLDINGLQCCQGLARGNQLRSITFDQTLGDSYVYVLDQTTGIYQVIVNGTGCPTALRPINTLGTSSNLQFVIDRGLYFASGSVQNGNDNSLLIIANGTNSPRSITIGITIVAIHISVPGVGFGVQTVETCFNGITYNDYRVAVVLAALFGTIMGVFMCVNTLFCLDFFMTKRIIRNLKQQIPHNLLEDRWNRLVEEKYAKLALEKQRKKDDPPPPPPPKRRSSASARKNSSVGVTDPNTGSQATGEDRRESLQGSNPIPKISAYIRRKSEDYLSRRRSDDYRSQRQQGREESPQNSRTQTTAAQIHPVQEEHEIGGTQLRQNLSRRALLKEDVDFL